MSCLCLPSKTETSCDEGQASDPPKVLKVFNRSLLFDCASRADAEALGGLLEYLQSQDKRLTDEDFRGDGASTRTANSLSEVKADFDLWYFPPFLSDCCF